MIATAFYTIINVLKNKWKLIAFTALLVIEIVIVKSGTHLERTASLSPVPLYILRIFLLIACAGIISKDFSLGKFELLFSKPISAATYWLGKILGIFGLAVCFDVFNLLFLDLASLILQGESISLMYLGGNLLMHLFDIVVFTLIIMIFSLFVPSGYDSGLLLLLQYGLGTISRQGIIPGWLAASINNFQFSDAFFRNYKGIDDSWIAFWMGFMFVVIILSTAGAFLTRKKIQS